MLKWFKRRAQSAPPDGDSSGNAPARPAPPRRPPVAPTDPMPLPEVVAEGNTQADWSVWEDSMMSLDSQLQGLAPTGQVYVRDSRHTRPNPLDEPDVFGTVNKNRDL